MTVTESRRRAGRLAAAWVAASLVACGGPAPDAAAPAGSPTQDGFHATEVSGIDYGRGIVLRDTEGQLRRLEDYRGSVTVVFFGFVSCPDVCPTTLLRLRQVREAMGAAGRRVRVLFVTVDPERDTPERLRAYVKQFDPDFEALRPEPAELADVVKAFRVVAVRVPIAGTDGYTIDHSAVQYVYGIDGRLRLVVSPDITVAELSADLTRLTRD